MVNPWVRLSEVLKFPQVSWVLWVLGGLVGLAVPAEIFCVGWIIHSLSGVLSDGTTPWLGEWIRLPVLQGANGIVSLKSVSFLIAIAFSLALFFVVCLSLLEYLASQIGLQRTQQVYRAIFRKSGQLAMVQSICGQQTTLKDAMQQSLPQVRTAWEAWYRMVPRYVAQGLGCVLLALCIHPVIAVLSLVCVALIWQIFHSLDLRERTSLPVLQERIQGLRQRVGELCETGPLLAFAHEEVSSQGALDTQLRSLQQAEEQLGARHRWKKPVLVFLVALAVCFVGFVLAVSTLQVESRLHVASVFVFFASVAAATWSTYRLHQVWHAYQEGKERAKVLIALLTQLDDRAPATGNSKLNAIRSTIEFDHVTMRDSEGRRLLEDVCLTLQPGKLVAIIASESIQARAVSEILLGFGQPVSGRILMDGINTIDIDPTSLRHCSAWIGPDGPLVAGTLEDNLNPEHSGALVELTEAVRAAGVYEAIQNLSDGLTTLVAPHDDRLKPDYLFRLGVARSLVKKPSLVVAEEPAVRVSNQLEAETLDALRQLTSRGMFVVVLPNRLTTLRHADAIVVLHENRVSAVGTHAELLESSELYRHLNYIRFSPLRHISA